MDDDNDSSSKSIVAVSTVDILNLDQSSIAQECESPLKSQEDEDEDHIDLCLPSERHMWCLLLSWLTTKAADLNSLSSTKTSTTSAIDDDDDEDDQSDTGLFLESKNKLFAVLVKADIIENRLRRDAFRKVMVGDDPSATAELLGPLSDDSRYRWPPYPVLLRYFSINNEKTIIPGHLHTFNPPTETFSVPPEPRKSYNDAMSMIDWGYWIQGISAMAKLAAIGFLPARTYFDPIQSPLQNPTGQFYLARYLHQSGDVEYAALWYRRSAETGDPNAMLELGRLLSVGSLESDTSSPFIQRDDGEAMVWFHRAWKLAWKSDAAFSIGKLYMSSTWSSCVGGRTLTYDPPWESMDVEMARGKPVYRDVEKATFWFTKASAGDHMGADAALGELKLQESMSESASAGADGIRLLRRAAERGVPRGMFVLGECLCTGVGPIQHASEGKKWLRKAADKGFSEDIFNNDFSAKNDEINGPTLSSIIESDCLSRCVPFLKSAARKDKDAKAMYILGFLYTRGGLGVSRDIFLGARWLKRAADGGVDSGAVAQFAVDTSRRTSYGNDVEDQKSKISYGLLESVAAHAEAVTGGSILGSGGVFGSGVSLNTSSLHQSNSGHGKGLSQTGFGAHISPITPPSCIIVPYPDQTETKCIDSVQINY